MARCALANELRWRDGERIIAGRLAQPMLNQQSANTSASVRLPHGNAAPRQNQRGASSEATES
jgi:hypothetical protein